MNQTEKKSPYGTAFYIRITILLILLGGAIWAFYTKDPTTVRIVNQLFGRSVDSLNFSALSESELKAEQEAFSRLSIAGILVIREPSQSEVQPGAVTAMNMTGKPMTNEIANDIACLMRLKSADFSSSGITDEQMNCIVSLQDLENLILTETPITDKGVVLAGHCPKLAGLQVVGTGITDAGLAEVMSKCPRIKILNLNNCKKLTNQAANTLSSSEVEHLLIQGTNLDDGCIDAIVLMPTLRRLSMGGSRITPNGVARLQKQLPALTIDQDILQNIK